MTDAEQTTPDDVVDVEIWCGQGAARCPWDERHLWGAPGCVDATPAANDRAGEQVRDTWVQWVTDLPDDVTVKPSWRVPWHPTFRAELDDLARDADRAISLALLTPVYDWLAKLLLHAPSCPCSPQPAGDKPEWLDVELLASAYARLYPDSSRSLEHTVQAICEALGWKL